MRILLLAAATALLPQAACPATPGDADRVALTRLAADLDAVWDAGDPAAVSALYAVDGSLRMDGRPVVQGRDAVQRYFVETMGRRPAGARHVTHVEHIDMLTPDLALVDTRVSIERDDAQGRRDVLAEFHNQTLSSRQAEGWRFRAVRAQRVANPMPASQPQGAAR
ncbi:YybH family protein [Agrilutibacter solisilvae]|uniref:SgcJ/EcaC family oxidoreductase n=1 Tax=Agrilutibacter solisilvae TaxID=2763317 RepID=A0A975ASF5_9GAMM|nr:SgcJ/EcaC family oxidoreductase [Lysobacter solisilvae]QSX78697.1 SgcJ/EcaC family oxidoreductase [Lysobacter solisilvae]